MSIDIFKQTNVRRSGRRVQPVREGISQIAVGGGADLIGVAAGAAIGADLQEVVAKISQYQADQEVKEEAIRVTNKNSVEVAKLERRIQLQMDEWKEDPNFATWTPAEFGAKWANFEKKEYNNLKNIIYKNDEEAFAKFESAYYTVFNNNRRIFRAEKQDKIRLDTMILLNSNRTKRYSDARGLSKEQINDGTFNTWFSNELKSIISDAKLKNTIDGSSTDDTYNQAEAELRKITWETIFRKAQIFQITNELYDPDNEEFSNETITDWDKVINYIKNEDAYEGKNGKKFFLPATMKNDLLKWAEGERDNQEARIRLEKEKRKDEGLTFLTKEVLTQYDEKNPSAYITEAEIREKGVAAGLNPKTIKSLISARRDFLLNKNKQLDDTSLYEEILLDIITGETTDGLQNNYEATQKVGEGKGVKTQKVNIINHPGLNTSTKIKLLEKISEMKSSTIAEGNKLLKTQLDGFKNDIKGRLKTNAGSRRYSQFVIEKTIEFNEKLGKPAEFGSKKGEILTASDLLVKDSEYYIFKDIQNYAVDYNRDLNQKVDEIKGDSTIGVEKKPIDNIEINAKGHYLIKDDNDYDKIPSGSKFVDPDSGEIRVKP